jgi:trimeric autotransporter adhesin
VKFDLAGSGTPIQMSWTATGADNAFLALPGADGLIHNGHQLFGNFTTQPQSATPNGFAALAVYDDPKNGGNGDGVIDAKDAIFSMLRLWIDANHDGISQAEELHTLPSLGVNSISLNYKADQRTDQYGNLFRYRAQVNPGDTTSTGRMAYDVFFVTTNTTTKNIAPVSPCQVPAIKVGMLAPVGGSR